MILKDYEAQIFQMLKPLVTQGVQVYLNTVDEDEDDQPLDFVLYRANVANYASVYGDGVAQIRNSDCDIIVNEYGTGNNEGSGYLVRLVEQILVDHEISYIRTSGLELGENSAVQTTFSFTL